MNIFMIIYNEYIYDYISILKKIENIVVWKD